MVDVIPVFITQCMQLIFILRFIPLDKVTISCHCIRFTVPCSGLQYTAVATVLAVTQGLAVAGCRPVLLTTHGTAISWSISYQWWCYTKSWQVLFPS